MLGEASTTKIARKKDAKGFAENKDAAKEVVMLLVLLEKNSKEGLERTLFLVRIICI